MKGEELWVGTIPDIFGYGMSVLAGSEAEARKALKAEYRRWKKAIEEAVGKQPEETTFEGSFENFGGSIRRITMGKVYYDNFGE